MKLLLDSGADNGGCSELLFSNWSFVLVSQNETWSWDAFFCEQRMVCLPTTTSMSEVVICSQLQPRIPKKWLCDWIGC